MTNSGVCGECLPKEHAHTGLIAFWGCDLGQLWLRRIMCGEPGWDLSVLGHLMSKVVEMTPPTASDVCDRQNNGRGSHVSIESWAKLMVALVGVELAAVPVSLQRPLAGRFGTAAKSSVLVVQTTPPRRECPTGLGDSGKVAAVLAAAERSPTSREVTTLGQILQSLLHTRTACNCAGIG